MPIDLTYTLRLDVDGTLPNLRPSSVAWMRKARTGKLIQTAWGRQLHDELDAMLAEVMAERKRAREAVGTVKRKVRYSQTKPDTHLLRRSQTPIYERALVKRGGADFVSRASRTSPSPSASVDLAHLRPVRGRGGRATRNTSSEPEAEGDLPPSMPAVYESVSRRDVIRSTIYSGSPGLPSVATKPVSKGRHHSLFR
jgi:hypothetical protein